MGVQTNFFCIFALMKGFADSQPELLKRLHGVQRRGGVPLQNLHLVSVPHQGASDQLIEQGLLGQVDLIPVCPPASVSILVQHHVGCTGGERHPLVRCKPC